MSAATSKNKYCFDSSIFMTGWRVHYPQVSFAPLWERMAEIMKDGRIIVPKEVEKEILAGDDDLKVWFKANNDCVRPYTADQIAIVSAIVNKYPKVSQYHKDRPRHADPFVIALAKVEKAIVVTYESPNGSRDNPSIATLCQEHGIECCNMGGFFEKEGVNFKLV
jgi:Domain of unknown function (DUF4411)